MSSIDLSWIKTIIEQYADTEINYDKKDAAYEILDLIKDYIQEINKVTK